MSYNAETHRKESQYRKPGIVLFGPGQYVTNAQVMTEATDVIVSREGVWQLQRSDSWSSCVSDCTLLAVTSAAAIITWAFVTYRPGPNTTILFVCLNMVQHIPH